MTIGLDGENDVAVVCNGAVVEEVDDDGDRGTTLEGMVVGAAVAAAADGRVVFLSRSSSSTFK
jgi:hypothetical protein